MCIIRPAQVCDAKALIALMKSQEGEANLINEIGDFSFTVEQEIGWIERFADAPNSVFLIAEVEGQIVGTCGCYGGSRKRKNLWRDWVFPYIVIFEGRAWAPN